MLKIRLQGTTQDIKWFLKILKRDRRFISNIPSDPLPIKGTIKYKRVFTEIFRDEDDYRRTSALAGPRNNVMRIAAGPVFVSEKNGSEWKSFEGDRKD